MHIIVNGERREVSDDLSVAALVAELGLPDRGVAVAVQQAVVPKGRWAETLLQEGADVEILTAVQGG